MVYIAVLHAWPLFMRQLFILQVLFFASLPPSLMQHISSTAWALANLGRSCAGAAGAGAFISALLDRAHDCLHMFTPQVLRAWTSVNAKISPPSPFLFPPSMPSTFLFPPAPLFRPLPMSPGLWPP